MPQAKAKIGVIGGRDIRGEGFSQIGYNKLADSGGG